MTGSIVSDLFEDGLKPYLPMLGALAVDSARIEWGLAGLLGILRNHGLSEPLDLPADRAVREIRKAVSVFRNPETDAWAGAVIYWARKAKNLLKQRGDLMHSSWIVPSDVDRDDLVRTGWLAASDAAPRTDVVYSRRLRGVESPRMHTVDGLSAFVADVHQHATAFPAAWFAALHLVGVLRPHPADKDEPGDRT